jgi:hypothetical protein
LDTDARSKRRRLEQQKPTTSCQENQEESALGTVSVIANWKENLMIDFDTAIELGEEVLASLEKLHQLIYTPQTATVSPDAKPKLPSLLQFRRRLFSIHAKRHLVTELAASGKLTVAEAQAMVDAGSAQTTTAPAASGTLFANILTWLQTNGPTIAADIAAAIPIIISLITLFGG